MLVGGLIVRQFICVCGFIFLHFDMSTLLMNKHQMRLSEKTVVKSLIKGLIVLVIFIYSHLFFVAYVLPH